MNINLKSLRATFNKITNWKTLGHDSIHKFWLKKKKQQKTKKFTSIHDRSAIEQDLQEANTWKDDAKANYPDPEGSPYKGTILSNYRPITWLPLMWEVLTASIRKEICYLLMCCGLLPEEQKKKKCCRRKKKRKEQMTYM